MKVNHIDDFFRCFIEEFEKYKVISLPNSVLIIGTGQCTKPYPGNEKVTWGNMTPYWLTLQTLPSRWHKH